MTVSTQAERRYLVHQELARHGVAFEPAEILDAMTLWTTNPSVRLLELSTSARLGVKGPGSLALLRAVGVDAAVAPNHVVRHDQGTLVAALSRSEFLLCEVPGASSTTLPRVRAALADDPANAYGVEHAQALYCFGVVGAMRDDVYARLCSIDFASPEAGPGRVLQTKLAHLNTIILRCGDSAASWDMLLGDVSYATFMWRTLLEIVRRLGGDALGIRVGEASRGKGS